MIKISSANKDKHYKSIKKLEKFSKKIKEILEKNKDVSDSVKLFHKLKTKLAEDVAYDDDDDLDIATGLSFVTELKEVGQTPRDVLPPSMQSGQNIPSWLSRNRNEQKPQQLPVVPPGINVRGHPFKQAGGGNVIRVEDDNSDKSLNETIKIAKRIEKLEEQVNKL